MIMYIQIVFVIIVTEEPYSCSRCHLWMSGLS